MGHIAQTGIPGFNTGLILSKFFNELNCSLISVSGDASNTYINVNDQVTFRIITSAGSANRSNYCYVVYNGTSTNLGFTSRPLLLTVCYSDNMFYMQGCSETGSNMTYAYHWCVIYEMFDGFSIYGRTAEAQTGRTSIFDNLSSLSIFDIGTSPQNNYVYKSKITSGEVSNSNILYSNGVLLTTTASTGLKVAESTNFLSCSDVSSGSVITFNGHNYYAIDTNMLMQIDEI